MLKLNNSIEQRLFVSLSSDGIAYLGYQVLLYRAEYQNQVELFTRLIGRYRCFNSTYYKFFLKLFKDLPEESNMSYLCFSASYCEHHAISTFTVLVLSQFYQLAIWQVPLGKRNMGTLQELLMILPVCSYCKCFYFMCAFSFLQL